MQSPLGYVSCLKNQRIEVGHWWFCYANMVAIYIATATLKCLMYVYSSLVKCFFFFGKSKDVSE